MSRCNLLRHTVDKHFVWYCVIFYMNYTCTYPNKSRDVHISHVVSKSDWTIISSKNSSYPVCTIDIAMLISSVHTSLCYHGSWFTTGLGHCVQLLSSVRQIASHTLYPSDSGVPEGHTWTFYKVMLTVSLRWSIGHILVVTPIEINNEIKYIKQFIFFLSHNCYITH